MAQDLEPSLLETFPSPPRLAEWILSRVVSKENEDVILGDFSEAFLDQVSEHGESAAIFWYWMELAKSVPSLLQQHKLTSFMTNKIIIGASVAIGIALYFFVFSFAARGTMLATLYESGPCMSIIVGLFFATLGLIVRGALLKPTEQIEYEKIQNAFNGIFIVTLLVSLLSVSLGFTLATGAIMKANDTVEISKMGGAINELLVNVNVGLFTAVLVKVAQYVFKGRLIGVKSDTSLSERF